MTWRVSNAADSSRVSSNSDWARRSRLIDTPTANRNPAVSCPTRRPTPSITAKVAMYCTSLTANDRRGDTKKKSNASTFISAAIAAGARPKRMATATTPTR